MPAERYAPKPLDANARRAQRVIVAFKAQLKESGTFKFPILVHDLSVTGFKFESSSRLHPGTRVWLNVTGLAPLEAEVKWRDGFLYGCAFTASLYPAVLDHIAKHANDQR
jgi:PilZ domain